MISLSGASRATNPVMKANKDHLQTQKAPSTAMVEGAFCVSVLGEVG